MVSSISSRNAPCSSSWCAVCNAKPQASYIDSNISGFVNLLKACKSANPQHAVVWAASILARLWVKFEGAFFGDRPDLPACESICCNEEGR
ncbi:hypothetical protein LguiA_030927 [Lonicera macranthoides]